MDTVARSVNHICLRATRWASRERQRPEEELRSLTLPARPSVLVAALFLEDEIALQGRTGAPFIEATEIHSAGDLAKLVAGVAEDGCPRRIFEDNARPLVIQARSDDGARPDGPETDPLIG